MFGNDSTGNLRRLSPPSTLFMNSLRLPTSLFTFRSLQLPPSNEATIQNVPCYANGF